MMQRMSKRLLGLTMGLTMGLVSLMAQAQERQVDIGGRKLHAISMGTGAGTGTGPGQATVVFEHGFSMDLSAWRLVAPELAQRAPVLLYSRAGHGQSDPLSGPPSLAQGSADLAALLKASQLSPPYVLVGHSYGGWSIRDFASRHPEQVAGLVFVEPAHEALDQRLQTLDAARLQAENAQQLNGAPARFRPWMQHVQQIAAAGRLPDVGPLPDVPAVVLTSTKRYEQAPILLHTPAGMAVWRQLHSELFAQFRSGAHILSPYSGHLMPLEQPALVISAVDQVLGLARQQAQQRAAEAARQALRSAVAAAASESAAGRHAEAEAALQQALSASRVSESELNQAGYGLLQNGQTALALVVLGHNARQQPDSDNAADSHGEALLAAGRAAQAQAEFERAIALGESRQRSPRTLEGYRRHLERARQARP